VERIEIGLKEDFSLTGIKVTTTSGPLLSG